MFNNTSPTDKALAYLTKQHHTEILNLNVIHKRNAGNLFDRTKNIPYEAKYKTKALAHRSAVMRFFEGKPINVRWDTYSEELVCLKVGQKIEKEVGPIPFSIYIELMGGPAGGKLDWNIANYSLEALQKKMFAGVEGRIKVHVIAPDIIENKRKYEEFHIEIMRRLKEQHIEKGDLDIFFLDDKIPVEKSRPYSAKTYIPQHIEPHVLQKWETIHNIKWYDMVKERPDKVLKYGKVRDKNNRLVPNENNSSQEK